MARTMSGSAKAVRTTKLKHGAGFYAEIGTIGGRKGRTGGFFANRELASRAGKIGGRISRPRTKQLVVA